MTGTIEHVAQQYLHMIQKYKAHIYKIKFQFKRMKELKETLKENECLVHIDFSENYVCKMNTEVQSYHFGGSKTQLSLHTVVLNTKNEIKSLCTICTDTNHMAHAVWAHLKPVFEVITKSYPEVDVLHVQSDGPSSQYKNRFNFNFITKIQNCMPNIRHVTWNFSVAGHGKGPADGIGGTVKRTADARVSNGMDINNISSFIEHVQPFLKSIELIKVEAAEIKKMHLERPLQTSAVKGISTIMQITWSSTCPDKLFARMLSCFSCLYNEVCTHYPHGSGSLKIQNKHDAKPKLKEVVAQEVLQDGPLDPGILLSLSIYKVAVRIYL